MFVPFQTFYLFKNMLNILHSLMVLLLTTNFVNVQKCCEDLKPVFTLCPLEEDYVGLKVQIPDRNFSYFSFRGTINDKTIVSFKTGGSKNLVNRRPGNMWIIDVETKADNFNVGDIFYYRIHVVQNDLEHVNIGQWKWKNLIQTTMCALEKTKIQYF